MKIPGESISAFQRPPSRLLRRSSRIDLFNNFNPRHQRIVMQSSHATTTRCDQSSILQLHEFLTAVFCLFQHASNGKTTCIPPPKHTSFCRQGIILDRMNDCNHNMIRGITRGRFFRPWIGITKACDDEYFMPATSLDLACSNSCSKSRELKIFKND